MNNKEPYLLARKQLVEDIKKELFGTEAADELVVDSPVKRYSTGMLFPFGYENRNKEEVAGTLADSDDESQNQTPDAEEGSDIEQASALANAFFPSVIGLSFYAKGEEPLLLASASYAVYEKIPWQEIFSPLEELPKKVGELQEFKDNFLYENKKVFARRKLGWENIDTVIAGVLDDKVEKSKIYTALHQIRLGHNDGAWKRVLKRVEIKIDGSLEREKVEEGLELVVNRRRKENGVTLFTVCLENIFDDGNDEHVFFQASIQVGGIDKRQVFLEYNTLAEKLADEEERSLAFLYRHKKTYAVGHGCAAEWKGSSAGGGPDVVYTMAVPVYELPAVDFSIRELPLNQAERVLSMKLLAGIEADDASIIKGLKAFSVSYVNWVKKLEARTDFPAEFGDEAKKNILLCKEVSQRMDAGIIRLESDAAAMKAFKLANKAMLLQSLHSDLQKNKTDVNKEEFEWPDPAKVAIEGKQWRPFQLAFLLLSLNGASDPAHKDRNIVDLIWFPTGGGKTEAYLGLSAYTIFYRRLKNGIQGGGTTVMMRYTLRLLTAQQFQRACTLICAMEKIRLEDASGNLGTEEISVGLWVGSQSTPNNIADAERRLADFRRTGHNLPSPLLSCPWCGTSMVTKAARGFDYAMKHKLRPGRMQLYCKEQRCPFNQALPVKVVDDEIYDKPPTLLFGTVDKFAQMPYRKGVASIFGLQGSGTLTPDLIIQDELHLISGSLGTMVALYETAVDFLCSRKGRVPKIIVSTATIRRAKEQCLNLFGREAKQFPANGLEIEDSFFTREDPAAPGRLYVGIMGSGKTQTTVAVRLAAALLTGVQSLKAEDAVRDNYWTLVGYFNSIRELGGFISLIYDDVGMYVNTLRERYGGTLRAVRILKELTSRESAEEIPRTLSDLSIAYPDKNAVDVVAATNMISVGVDIDRLGLMIVRGQPKLTSEYIQVTSRIGRKFPGLVAVLYNSARTRDRAHYERFLTYHASFYRNVEPSSITPFSVPARSRALRAVVVAMARHGLPGLGGEKDAVSFKKNITGVEEVKKFILARIQKIDPGEEEAARIELENIFEDWETFGSTQHDQGVYSNERSGRPLLVPAGNTVRGLWEAPTSMRNVDQECSVQIEDE